MGSETSIGPVGFVFRTPPCAPYETHSSWLLKPVLSCRTRFCQPPYWHFLAFAELPPASASGTRIAADTAATTMAKMILSMSKFS
jgi:hypothetical protein